MYFWEYEVLEFDEATGKPEKSQGLVFADSLENAASALDHYYDVLEVRLLKTVGEGSVFDFKLAREIEGFNWNMYKKLDKEKENG